MSSLSKVHYSSIDQYIQTFPAATQEKLTQLRKIIGQTATEAKEIISYNMPAFKQKTNLVYFAGYKNHIGFYPGSAGIEAFKSKLHAFKWSKGAIQFELSKPLPEDLIIEIVKYRIAADAKKR